MDAHSSAWIGVVQSVFNDIADGLAGPVPVTYQLLSGISVNENLLAFALGPGRQLADGLGNQVGHGEILFFKRNVSRIQPRDFQHGLNQIFHTLQRNGHFGGKLPHRIGMLRFIRNDLLIHGKGSQGRL